MEEAQKYNEIKSKFEVEREAEAIHNNEQLLTFNIRSKNVDWTEHVMPLQSRSPPVYLHRQFSVLSNYREIMGTHNRRELLLCHDLMGNYLEDRHFHSSKKYDSYRFYHWSAVDIFCYFSHNYITIPPAGWINAAHKHGVRVLGTFITENLDGYKRLHEVLQSQDMINNVVDALVMLCKHFGFEGWFINVECSVDAQCINNLCYFLDILRYKIKREIPYGIVIWYDSVIENGKLSWQNELNDFNVRFYNLSHRMLINYGWDEKNINTSRNLCEKQGQPMSDKSRVYFGIDIFGRGQIAKFLTRNTLERIVKENFSVGIFAPAWTYETLQNYGYNLAIPSGSDDVNSAFLERNEKFWWLLWEFLGVHPYNKMPFYTDFCLGSGKSLYKYGIPISLEPFFNLFRQSLQPSIPLYEMAKRCYDKAFNGGSCLKILQHNLSFRLIVSDFYLKFTGLVFAYAYKMEYEQPNDSQFDCVLRLCNNNSSHNLFLFMGDYNNEVISYKGRCYISPLKINSDCCLDEKNLCPEIPPYNPVNDSGWRTRYYFIEFDGSVEIKDIGVLHRKIPHSSDIAYLGAIYLNEFDVKSVQFPNYNLYKIDVYKNQLFN